MMFNYLHVQIITIIAIVVEPRRDLLSQNVQLMKKMIGIFLIEYRNVHLWSIVMIIPNVMKEKNVQIGHYKMVMYLQVVFYKIIAELKDFTIQVMMMKMTKVN